LAKPKDWDTPQGLQAALALTKGAIENPLTDIVVKGVGELVRGAEPTPKSKYEALMQKAAQARKEAESKRKGAVPTDPAAPGSPAMQRVEFLRKQIAAMEQGMRGAPVKGKYPHYGHGADPRDPNKYDMDGLVKRRMAQLEEIEDRMSEMDKSSPEYARLAKLREQIQTQDYAPQWVSGPGVAAPPGYEEAKAELAQIYTQLGAIPKPDQGLMADADRLEEQAKGFEKQAKDMQLLSGVSSMSDLMAMVSSPNSTREHLAAALKAVDRFTPARTLTQWRKGVNPGDANRKRLVQAFLAGKPKPMTPYDRQMLDLRRREVERKERYDLSRIRKNDASVAKVMRALRSQDLLDEVSLAKIGNLLTKTDLMMPMAYSRVMHMIAGKLKGTKKQKAEVLRVMGKVMAEALGLIHPGGPGLGDLPVGRARRRTRRTPAGAVVTPSDPSGPLRFKDISADVNSGRNILKVRVGGLGAATRSQVASARDALVRHAALLKQRIGKALDAPKRTRGESKLLGGERRVFADKNISGTQAYALANRAAKTAKRLTKRIKYMDLQASENLLKGDLKVAIQESPWAIHGVRLAKSKGAYSLSGMKMPTVEKSKKQALVKSAGILRNILDRLNEASRARRLQLKKL
jgi:hypothetical protein